MRACRAGTCTHLQLPVGGGGEAVVAKVAAAKAVRTVVASARVVACERELWQKPGRNLNRKSGFRTKQT